MPFFQGFHTTPFNTTDELRPSQARKNQEGQYTNTEQQLKK